MGGRVFGVAEGQAEGSRGVAVVGRGPEDIERLGLLRREAAEQVQTGGLGRQREARGGGDGLVGGSAEEAIAGDGSCRIRRRGLA